GACFAFLILSCPASLSAASSPFDEHLGRILVEEGLVGAVWAQVSPDLSVAIGAAGIKDARTGEALGPEDRVNVGSIAKTVLATGVLRLVSLGRLSLDTPVSAILPDTLIDNRWATSDPVRVRHLLDHTSGLDDLRLWQIFSLKADADTTLKRAFAGDALLRVRSRPGTRFSYSNMGYTLLGRIVEAVSGERYERYLDANLLAPLGMTDSTFGFVSQEGPQADPRLAMGHFEDRRTQAAVPTFLRPAGQFTTSAVDMGRFARFLMSDGRVNGTPFIDPRWLRSMGTPHETEAALGGLGVGYGLGLFTRDRNGVVGRCHGGSVVGYRAMLCLFPEQQRAYFWSVNTDSETADHNRLDQLFVDTLGIAAAEPVKSVGVSEGLEDWNGTYVPAPNRMASFRWLDTLFNFIRVRREGSALRIAPLQSQASLLVPVSSLLFRATDRAIASHALLTAADGTRVISTGTQTFAQIAPWRLVLLWASLVAGGVGLVWLLLSGLSRAVARYLDSTHPVAIPLIGILMLLLPLPFFWSQSFLQIGDLTWASGLLAIVTALLPLAMIVGLVMHFRRRTHGAMAMVDSLAMVAVVQLSLVLAISGLLPLRLWT
ncbi:MAG: serine hydrolase domain-containing protein, partial [Dokdonella sp.]